jgi:D-3-phosphoglycerate dehydrogenase / 2-oxoglutarate reductase
MKILVSVKLTSEVILELSREADVTTLEISEGGAVGEGKLVKALEELNPEVLIIGATPLSEPTIKKAPNMKLILSSRGNPVNVDTEYCGEHGIIVGYAPGRNATAVAEFTIGLILDITRKISESVERIKSGELTINGNWQKQREEIQRDVIWRHPDLKVSPYSELVGCELANKTIGLIGFGAIGRLMAHKCYGLDLKVIAYDPYVNGDVPDYVRIVSIEELAKVSDIVSVHAKVTEETKGLLGKNFFKGLKPGAYLVNTARGSLIDRFALIDALNDGTLSGAALDVCDYEPLCSDDPLLSTPGLVITPHIGGASSGVVFHHSDRIIKNFRSFMAGDKLPYLFR